MSKSRVIVVGSSNTDIVVHCERLPRAGETVLGSALHTFAGGKGANQAVAAARAGAKVIFIGAFGDDDYGRARRADLIKEGIDCSGCAIKKSVRSGVALIGSATTRTSSENLILVAPGANKELTSADLRRGMPKLTPRDIVLCSLEVPLAAVRAAFALAAAAGALRILNPAPFPKDGWPKNWRGCCDYLIPNELEFEALIGAPMGSSAAATKLRNMRLANHFIVTRGKRGVLCHFAAESGKAITIGAPKVNAVDTTGAGDCFNGAFAARLAEHLRRSERPSYKDMIDAVRFAVAAAALKVTRHGAQAGLPRKRQILKMLASRTGAATSRL